ncbi:efflux transporter, RND family, MFP subunit [Gloeothece citriformis PCC 7424]|uniref:Efflux transporter, RND family, MFP subunit n=1 Tax=Gloeothece citriformis (strain PCC 7424) TaxID=65393 RepID=B7KG38_GLOC7|nr:efflux RND transporter periplasmic adaptor subunit [Gloeothece citriformis]ACK69231.1 efflux transporter, RND family, MFP subunit [Gloeothece citriformis PCC 7424]
MLKLNRIKNSSVKWQLLSKVTLLTLLGTTTIGCQNLWDKQVDAQPQSQQPENTAIAVDAAIAKSGNLREDIEYTGNTAPVREVSLRSQVEGQLQELTVDVGDEVKQGEILARLDDKLLLSEVSQAKAQKAAQRSQVVQAQSQVNDALIRVEQARLELQQAQADITRLQASLNATVEQARLEAQQTAADAARLRLLAQEGAIPEQQAEQAETEAKQAQQILLNQQASAEQQISQAQTAAQTAAQILRSAEAQVKIEQQQVSTAQAQVEAQRELMTQAKTRQSYSILTSPVTGKVLEKVSEPGNLIQPGTEILKLGDFSRVKVIVEVSELQRSKIKTGQRVDVKLDAFPQENFLGIVTRISPAADPTARLIPVEITISNPEGKIGSGLLARVSFSQGEQTHIVVPETALQDDSTIYIIQENTQNPTVKARSVVVGNKANGQVEILSGLSEGEHYVVRSSEPLNENQTVRLSILSEPSKPTL